ncbi:hypothetical protein KC723_03180 [Candidatus Kaiserbacteria bacterium]|nr:hypothetical protein [Candidatus Kaiserbacteria bacterium]
MNQIIEPDFEGEEMKLPSQEHRPITEESLAKPQHSGALAVIVILSLVLVAIGSAVFIWFTGYLVKIPAPTPDIKIERPTPEQNNEPESTTAEASTERLNVVSNSDNLDLIEADLTSTNLPELDADLNAIEAELENTEVQ